MAGSPKINNPRVFRGVVNVFKPRPTETKVEQEKPTPVQHQNKYKTKMKWPFKPKKDQKISKAKTLINLDNKIAEITMDDLWYCYRQFSLGALSPSVQLRYNKPDSTAQLRDDKSFSDKRRKRIASCVLEGMQELLSEVDSVIICYDEQLDLTERFEKHLRKKYSSPEKFFNKFFDICNDFFPLDERFVLFFKKMTKAIAKTKNKLTSVISFFENFLCEVSKLPDPLAVFEDPSIFEKIKNTTNLRFSAYTKFVEECEKILSKYTNAKKSEEGELQDKMKVFAESTFTKHPVPGEKSFYERIKELLQIELSMDDFFKTKARWAEIRSNLLENDEIKVVSFGERLNTSEVPASWDIDRILQERTIRNFSTKMNDSLPQNPNLLEYFVFLVLTNGPFFFHEWGLANNLKSFLRNLKKEDKTRIANMKIELVEGDRSVLLPLPVFLCLYRKSYNDYLYAKDVMESIGLDAFNVKFKFNKEEYDIMSFLEMIQKSNPEKEETDHFLSRERNFNYLFQEAAKLCDKLKVVKKELELAENKEQTTVSSDQPQRSEKTPSTKIEASDHSEPSRNSLNVDEKTKEEETKPDNTVHPDTKVHVEKLDCVSRNAANEIMSVA